MSNKSKGQDNRQAVRVVDRILFTYGPVSVERFKQIAEDFNKGIPPYNQAGLADIQMFIGAQNALGRIHDKDKDLGEFLQHLDSKINLILKEVRDKETPLDKLKLQEVNISASGVAFFSEKPLKPNTLLEFHLVLPPGYTYVYCFGKVVNCNEGKSKDPEKPFYVSAKLILIMEEDREKLIEHNFKQQSLALRQRRKKT